MKERREGFCFAYEMSFMVKIFKRFNSLSPATITLVAGLLLIGCQSGMEISAIDRMKHIQKGMSADKVIEILGAPVLKTKTMFGDLEWVYISSNKSAPNQRKSWVVFDKDLKVKETWIYAVCYLQ